MPMKTCRHLKDFLVTEKAVGPNTGLPPFVVLCEDCAAGVTAVLTSEIKRITDAKPSGKSGRAQNWAWYRRIHQDITAPTDIAHQAQLAANLEAKLQAERGGTLSA